MTDPYREEATRRHEALLADERTLLVRAGKVMVYAGIVGLIAVLVGLKAAVPRTWLCCSARPCCPGCSPPSRCRRGLVLARLPGGGRDYHAIETAVRSLGVVYTIKGVVVLIAVAAYVGLLLMNFGLGHSWAEPCS
jgi:hypothetical protein